jgi:hypothetical protein
VISLDVHSRFTGTGVDPSVLFEAGADAEALMRGA